MRRFFLAQVLRRFRVGGVANTSRGVVAAGVGLTLLGLTACGGSSTENTVTPASQVTDPSGTASSATPTAVGSDMDYSQFLPIDFDLTDREGWSYHVSITGLPVVRAEPDVSLSPPGKALVRYSLEGDPEATLTSLDTGRTAPSLNFMVDYRFASSDYDAPNTLSYGVDASGEQTERPTWTCSSQGTGTPDCLMVAFLHSETPSEANVGEPVTPDLDESEATGIATAFLPDRLESVELTLTGGRGGCIIAIDVATKKMTARSGISTTKPDCTVS